MSNTYTFISSEGGRVTMMRGDGIPKMTGGGGGWSIEARPRRVGLTIWKGRDPYTMDVPVLFDGWMDDNSQENEISVLNQMQMGGDLKEPPTVTIEGAVPVKGIRWVISGIDWGDQVIYDDNSRYRQDAVVHLTQYNPEDRLKTFGGGNLQTPRIHVVRKGETLRSIANQYYKDANKWKIIAAANNIRDPKSIKKMVGKSIRIP
jgi:hypothetical protein